MRRLIVVSAASTIAALAFLTVGCRDTAGFSSGSGHYEGAVVSGRFVRAGIADQTRACVTLDADHFQDAPGALWTDDGRFHATPLRPIPQIWHDPLSTLSFGEGRTKNLIYVVSPNGDGGLSNADVFAVVSLMQAGTVEVRLMRGAPSSDGGDVDNDDLFGVFDLESKPGPCPF